MLTFNAIERGWFAETGAHSAELRNTSAGIAGDLGVLRTFLVFDLSSLEDSITEATLHLELEAYLSSGGHETLVVSGVMTPARAMTMTYRPGTAAGRTIFEALGSGVEYGRATVTASDVGRVIEIPLNADALVEMQAAAGRLFAVGIHLENATPSQADHDLLKMVRFSAASEERRHQLVVDVTVASEADRDGVFGLQYDVVEGEVNRSLRDVVKAQATTLEAMLQSVLEAVVRTEDRRDMEEAGKQAYLKELIQRTSDQLALFAQNHVRVEQRIGEVLVGPERPESLSKQCVNLLHDLERVNTVLHANLAVARRYLDLMRDQHAAESDTTSEVDPLDFE
ncbi:hypothetical protein C2W62_24825 [Candidatus Entotheonella serta]|nr:hypothetical protein C2W62_24825 [Candidatus Entotheonella serta]